MFKGGEGEEREAVQVIEEIPAPLGLLGDEGQVAQAEFLERVGEVEHVHLFGFLNLPTDGPVFVQFQGIEHETDERIERDED